MIDGTGQRLYRHARERIPGGTQLLSKRPEMFLPEGWPAYYSRAKGTRIWDMDGREYREMSYHGIGACLLGYADPDVDAAVRAAVDGGSMATLNAPEEVELADLLCEIHPWADKVRFARGGGEAMVVALRIARASTKRDKVAFCGYHGWHDWYLAANLGESDSLSGHLLPGLDPAGVPRGLRGTSFPFQYNRLDELEGIVQEHGRGLAAIVMEPLRNQEPDPGFLQGVRRIADETGAVLIFDEVTSGFRQNSGGVHLRLGVTPDIAVFAKGMSNGYPMAAIIGKALVMHAAESSFISSTYWTERIGPAAAIATIRKHQQHDVGHHLGRIGHLVKRVWEDAAKRQGLNVHVGGIDPLAHFSMDGPEGQAGTTLYTMLMLERGFLAGKGFYASFAHRDEDVQAFAHAVDESFAIVAKAIAGGNVASLLPGSPAHSGFRRLT